MNTGLPPEIVAIDKRRKRKKWLLISTVLAGLVVVCIVFYLIITSIIESSDAYKTAQDAVNNLNEITEITGGTEDMSMANGHISINNGEGTASFIIDVDGKRKDAEIYIELEQKPLSDWKVINYTIKQEK